MGARTLLTYCPEPPHHFLAPLLRPGSFPPAPLTSPLQIISAVVRLFPGSSPALPSRNPYLPVSTRTLRGTLSKVMGELTRWQPMVSL